MTSPTPGSRPKRTILVVDDDASMCDLLATQLELSGFRAVVAQRADEAQAILSREPVDAVVTDLRMPGVSGTELCREIVQTRADVPVILMTGFGSIENAIEAIRAGAYDFVIKPFEFERLALTLEHALEHRRLRTEVERLRERVDEAPGFAGLIGTSPVMRKVFSLVERLSASDAPVLVTGESGTGKELLAQALHRHSKRANGPFVGVNCAAVPEQLLESELFGHERGAFTDARVARPGLLRQAHGGTLFLDEIGDMSATLQPKLLRALQEKVVRPVGSDREVPVDVRLVSATNQAMKTAVDSGRFRADLFYRVAVVVIELPPLRERGDDIVLLAEHFCDEIAASQGRPLVRIGNAAEQALLRHRWPGNVRELRNAMEHALALCTGDEVLVEHLPDALHEHGVDEAEDASRPPAERKRFASLSEVEREHVLRVLEAVEGNKSQAARILGIDRKTLHAKLQRYEHQGE